MHLHVTRSSVARQPDPARISEAAGVARISRTAEQVPDGAFSATGKAAQPSVRCDLHVRTVHGLAMPKREKRPRLSAAPAGVGHPPTAQPLHVMRTGSAAACAAEPGGPGAGGQTGGRRRAQT